MGILGKKCRDEEPRGIFHKEPEKEPRGIFNKNEDDECD